MNPKHVFFFFFYKFTFFCVYVVFCLYCFHLIFCSFVSRPGWAKLFLTVGHIQKNIWSHGPDYYKCVLHCKKICVSRPENHKCHRKFTLYQNNSATLNSLTFYHYSQDIMTLFNCLLQSNHLRKVLLPGYLSARYFSIFVYFFGLKKKCF